MYEFHRIEISELHEIFQNQIRLYGIYTSYIDYLKNVDETEMDALFRVLEDLRNQYEPTKES